MKSLFRFNTRDGYLFLTSYTGEEEVVEIPTVHKGNSVTGISRKCFLKCEREAKNKIKKIIVPDTVEVIEQNGFADLTSLETVVLPKNLQLIKQYAFKGCKALDDITFHENLKTISTGAFIGCTSLSKITSYSKDVSVGKDAFPNDIPLKDVSLNLIGSLDKYFQANLTKNLILKFDTLNSTERKELISFVNRRQNLKKDLFSLDDSRLIDILLQQKINVTLVALNDYLEYHISKENTAIIAIFLEFKEKNFSKGEIDSLKERKDLVEIGFEYPTFTEFRRDWKFLKRDDQIIVSGYKGILTKQTIPKYLDDGTPITVLDKSNYNNFSTLEILNIEAELIEVKGRTFYNCINLQRITLPDSIKIIDILAFAGCTNLIEIVLPPDITEINQYAFKDCTTLKEIILPDNLNYIGYQTFSGCGNLVEVIIPPKVTVLSRGAFYNCKNLNKVEILAEIIILEQNVFSNCSSLKKVVLPSTLQAIKSAAFSYCRALEEITIPATVTSINYDAFEGCINLKQVNFLGEVLELYWYNDNIKINKI